MSIEINNQIPSGGCANCGKFADETQQLQKVFMARTSSGEWFCAECLADMIEKSEDEKDDLYIENNELRDQIVTLEHEMEELQEEL